MFALALCGAAHAVERAPLPIRAVWVDAWGAGLFTPQECDEMLDWCRRHRINTILVQMRRKGDVLYPSALEPRVAHVAEGFDPLAYLLRKAKQPPVLRVEAWVVANRVWCGSPQPPASTPPHVLTRHPDWALMNDKGHIRDAEGNMYLDPALPAARAHTARVAAEIAQRYAVDGIHLDYIRYPDNSWGYNRESLRRFQQEINRHDRPTPDDDDFTHWRAEQVTEMVREVRQAVRAARSTVELSAATLTWGGPSMHGFRGSSPYKKGLQDWATWCDTRLLDVMYVMHYKREYEQPEDYRAWFPVLQQHRGPGKARIVIGQGSYLNNIPDSMRQLREAHAAGFDGVGVYSYRVTNMGEPDRMAFGRALLSGPFGTSRSNEASPPLVRWESSGARR